MWRRATQRKALYTNQLAVLAAPGRSQVAGLGTPSQGITLNLLGDPSALLGMASA